MHRPADSIDTDSVAISSSLIEPVAGHSSTIVRDSDVCSLIVKIQTAIPHDGTMFRKLTFDRFLRAPRPPADAVLYLGEN
jgi:hypothetical protein